MIYVTLNNRNAFYYARIMLDGLQNTLLALSYLLWLIEEYLCSRILAYDPKYGMRKVYFISGVAQRYILSLTSVERRL